MSSEFRDGLVQLNSPVFLALSLRPTCTVLLPASENDERNTTKVVELRGLGVVFVRTERVPAAEPKLARVGEQRGLRH
jgi:hypothetical protein